MENKQTLIGEVTADQINAWKEQHGEVFAIKVNGHVCYKFMVASGVLDKIVPYAEAELEKL